MKDVFVFGSNLAGRHGAGAALAARQQHGAIYGQGWGLQGDSYAIPTKDGRGRRDLTDPKETLPLEKIKWHVDKFLAFAGVATEVRFNVTRIGCGRAGYTDEQIAPMFAGAPDNCILPEGWREMSTPAPVKDKKQNSIEEAISKFTDMGLNFTILSTNGHIRIHLPNKFVDYWATTFKYNVNGFPKYTQLTCLEAFTNKFR